MKNFKLFIPLFFNLFTQLAYADQVVQTLTDEQVVSYIREAFLQSNLTCQTMRTLGFPTKYKPITADELYSDIKNKLNYSAIEIIDNSNNEIKISVSYRLNASIVFKSITFVIILVLISSL